jgi:hypothetical protein
MISCFFASKVKLPQMSIGQRAFILSFYGRVCNKIGRYNFAAGSNPYVHKIQSTLDLKDQITFKYRFKKD